MYHKRLVAAEKDEDNLRSSALYLTAQLNYADMNI